MKIIIEIFVFNFQLKVDCFYKFLTTWEETFFAKNFNFNSNDLNKDLKISTTLLYSAFNFIINGLKYILNSYLFIAMNSIVFVVWFTKERRLALFPAGIVVRDPHHHESPTQREQDLDLRKHEFRLC